MTHTVDTIVIGAGIVGLAVARALAMSGREVVVLEKNRGIGEEISARNSEVIHAGLYYAPGSLKARLCVAGKQLLYEYCAKKGVAHRRCGKVIIAIHDEQERQARSAAENCAGQWRRRSRMARRRASASARARRPGRRRTVVAFDRHRR